MEISQFVAGPCSWNPVAPAGLRPLGLSSAYTWRSYSTAKFLNGSKPCVLDTARVSGFPFNSGLRLELLPTNLASRWKSLGLQFATKPDIENIGFEEVLAKSLELMRLVPPLYGTVTGVCRSVHVLLGSAEGYDVSYSDPSLPFSIFVSCPAEGEPDRCERLAENILHEALHLQLSLIERIRPLVADGAEEQRVLSPWRQGERSIGGLLHAIYVFGNLRCFWRQVACTCPSFRAFAQARVESINIEVSMAVSSLESRHLTQLGRAISKPFLDTPSAFGESIRASDCIMAPQ